jgi:cytoskeletal protein CcmA (bactofilin family)
MCEGCVTIAKGGSLEGVVYAKAINVDKGGIFSGELFIGQQEMTQPDLLTPDEDRRGFFGDDSLEFRPA